MPASRGTTARAPRSPGGTPSTYDWYRPESASSERLRSMPAPGGRRREVEVIGRRPMPPRKPRRNRPANATAIPRPATDHTGTNAIPDGDHAMDIRNSSITFNRFEGSGQARPARTSTSEPRSVLPLRYSPDSTWAFRRTMAITILATSMSGSMPTSSARRCGSRPRSDSATGAATGTTGRGQISSPWWRVRDC